MNEYLNMIAYAKRQTFPAGGGVAQARLARVMREVILVQYGYEGTPNQVKQLSDSIRMMDSRERQYEAHKELRKKEARATLCGYFWCRCTVSPTCTGNLGLDV